jgi:hypothetical protein
MNERIQELAEQAGLESFYVEYSPWQVEFEKFAELIVREYTQQLIQHGVVSADGTIVKDIQKHFGVES